MNENISTNQNLFNNFTNKGYKLTKPRKAILEILYENNNHPCAEDIYFEVHKKYPTIGMMTVYRTLELLVVNGFLHKFDFCEGKARYELIDHPHGIGHHHHLVCLQCKKIINYTDFIDQEVELFKKIEKRLSNKYNFKIHNHIVEFHGICKECENNNDSSEIIK